MAWDFFGGLNYYHPLKNRFRNIKHEPYKNSLSDNVVSCIVEDEHSMLWIGTNDGGLNRYNPLDNSFQYYFFNTENKGRPHESNNVKSIYIDKSTDNVYVGTHAGGMKVVNRRSGMIKHLSVCDDNSAANSIYVILPRSNNSLWLGTLNGLYWYDMNTCRFVQENDVAVMGKSIYAMFIDSQNSLLVATNDGVVKYKTENNKLEKIYLK